ncbi:MAG: glycosyltransferase [Gammaproteobacteria bacterium]|jgi:glycosyltransferase involved in cell wall biosynthesis|nr:glycosyltransferase [Gammaproteobacteria bacterium]
MNIVMVTNTYLPHIGGVARSIESFTREYRLRGHRVLVVAPEFPGQPENECDVVRIPAIQNFNGSDFSVVLPAPGVLSDALERFEPDIIHSHHPYLLGMTALRKARKRDLPLVFTHHTLYERYTHYVPGDSPTLARFVIELATRYANLTDHVFAPSESVATLIRKRGVKVPVTVVPTGVEMERFEHGDGRGMRRRLGIVDDDFVVGHVGRLAAEKNLDFLAKAVRDFLLVHPRSRFLIVGRGPAAEEIAMVFAASGLSDRIHMTGALDGTALRDAYHAMDVFAFSSKSETQGMVLTEAMAAGVPVVALDASGVGELVQDGEQGRLLRDEDIVGFTAALRWIHDLPPSARGRMNDAVRQRAREWSMSRTADRALAVYEGLLGTLRTGPIEELDEWHGMLERIKAEWDIVKGVAGAAGAAIATDSRPGNGR